MLRRLNRLLFIAALSGGLLFLYALIERIFPGTLPGLPLLSPSRALLAGYLLILCGLLFTPGYKRLPFWVNTAGTLVCMVLILAPADSNLPLNEILLILALLLFLSLARYCARAPRLNPKVFGLLLPGLLFSAALLPALILPGLRLPDKLVYGGELDTPAQRVMEKIDGAYRRIDGAEEEISRFLEERIESKRISRREENELIDELNARIAELKDDLDRYEALKKENDTYREEIDRLKDRIGEIEYDREYGEETAKVASIAEAVRADSPRVRDFAVRLAAAFPGSYYRYSGGSPVPGSTGIEQILAIHRYIAAEWKYVNDPLFTDTDYYSPADRTIALGLAGDCDDFAVLIAACIEAVGGKARILAGSCSEGGHAWCEAYIGDAEAWNETLRIAGSRYPGRRISYLGPRGSADYWLCLDWQAGVYSCGESPRLLYES